MAVNKDKILSAITPKIYKQVGELEARLTSKIKSYTNSITKSFETKVPSPATISSLKVIVNTLKSVVTSFKSRIQTLSGDRITNPLLRTSQALEAITFILKALPIPGTFTTAGAVVTFSDKVREASEFSDDLKESAENIKKLSDNVNSILENARVSDEDLRKYDTALELSEVYHKVESQLSNVDINIVNNRIYDVISSDTSRSNQAISEIRDILNLKPITTLEESFEGTDPTLNETIITKSGSTLTLKVIETSSEISSLTLRQAIAIDSTDKIVFATEKSFATNIQVLLEELKLKISLNNTD